MNKLLIISFVVFVAWLSQPVSGINQQVNLKPGGGDSLEIFHNKVISINAEPPGDRLCITLNQKVCDTCFTARVHNRWGEILWETKDISKCWVGTLPTDSLAPMGVYIVKVDVWFNEKKHRHTGNVTYVR
jgi:hypothetical protein